MIDQRCRALNDKAVFSGGECMVYVMARDQRVNDNHALHEAQQQACTLSVPLVVLFCLLPKTGYRAREHYEFMLAGLRQVEADLAAKNIGFHLLIGNPARQLPEALENLQPAAVYFDFNPLRGPMKLHQKIADRSKMAVCEVDTHNIVPAWIASDKQEVGARTLRPKIMRQLGDWLGDDANVVKHPYKGQLNLRSLQDSKADIDKLLGGVAANGTDISRFAVGEKAAHAALDDFIENRLSGYAERRNDPSMDGQSELNPYLHYGQLASSRIVGVVEEAARQNPGLREDADAFIEEIVVRKELSDNFCLYNPDYDKLAGAPQWAQKTLQKHSSDTRDFVYTHTQFEAADTHDDAWNAAQMQLKTTGKIHGYMRMYWAKKVLEWSKSPEDALNTLLYMNDFYHIDGGDPNGYVGILWSIAGLHDRPWFERPVYGQIRYMNANGLKRKFKIDRYISAYVKT